MELIEVQSNSYIAKKNDQVKSWYLIQQGSVIQKMDFSEIRLGKNSIIGFMEKDLYLCDYIAAEDTVLTAFICKNPDDIKKTLAGQEKARNIFLRSAVEQRHQLLCLYAELYNKARQFHSAIETLNHDYKAMCDKYKIPAQSFSSLDLFKPLVLTHKAEVWEQNNSISIMKDFLQEYLQLMGRDDNLTVGVIMEASAQMRRFRLGIGEIEAYLSYNKEILLSEMQNDIFKLYFDLAVGMNAKKYDITPVSEKLHSIAAFATKLNLYSERLISRRLAEFKDYDYDANKEDNDGQMLRKEIDITQTDSLSVILEYAGYSISETDEICHMIREYRQADSLSTDSAVQSLRKKITAKFYEIYYKAFLRAVKEEETLSPVLEMFLNFGFMDISFLGEERAKELYNLCSHLDICQSSHIYTIYRWLKCIYAGKKETSRSEFDQNYPAYLAELYRTGRITKEQMNQFVRIPEKRVEFEIQNMFAVVNKLTYGKISIFCPILSDADLINSIDKMLLTAEKLENALNEVRKLDYSVFYREVPFSDPANGIPNERIMAEILPDIILMPNAGTRGMMWQETSDTRSNTPGRFMFPIFTSVDLSDLMLGVIGQYRWEMCRKLEGIHWNDVREKSLTAEYCSYLQFYRKNNDLSPEAKEKIKNALARARNNYREVFVADYINWVKYESKGSFRLNKVARDIVIRYCPFVKSIRNELKANPVYQLSITKFETEMKKKQQRYTGLYNKLSKAGNKIAFILEETISFYDM